MRWLWLSVPLLSLTLACGDSDTSPATGGAGGASTGGTGGTAGAGGSGGCRPQAGVEPGPDWVCVTHVTGTVVGETSAAVHDVLMTACGPGGCEPDYTDTSGAFTIEVGFPILVDDWSIIPHGREDGKMVYYFPLNADAPGPTIDMGTLVLLDTPAGGEELVVRSDMNGAPAQTVTHNGVTMEVPDGVRVDLDFEDVSLGPEGKRFRAKRIPAEHFDTLVPPTTNAVAAYAFTPFDAAFKIEAMPLESGTVRITLPNDGALPANSAVEILQHGSFIVGTLPPGDWEVVATATVSSDGTQIVMDAGEGIAFLTWLAVRPAT